ncbi:restriction endonuclease subunit S [Neisseria meningitidis]|uniref:restriction endonuclease subunit S n=1 Tax=Neisseria meningitidis TaxID=487 RepID=UPI000E584C4F|nr:restriction endonuclease subunit S [Neisseria meningitidis]MBH2011194.1 restriction endonuclease subunit S [Neisseria meningitidis]MBH2013271.1 restriction endonuclease subunit S [Neisseria meningitidis]MBH2021999.1 restriction endonuclease subunit S [Neisseria meningitidis]MBH2025393.1 restriction endonuclease subunit S [Neisseria meningitidis]MBH2027073.1 restriction endonuclease subunit S [Neisseria meningitidis]
MNSALENHATYINNKVDTNEISLSQYISTDNILQNKQGIECATSLPIQGGKVTAFKKGDILLANIRPYLKKIWYAQFDGGCSADVLAIRANAKTDSHFLFYALFRDDFFIHAMKGAKGTKMPRGDKTQIMEFKIPVFDLKTQQSIAAVLSALDKKIALNKQINARLEEMAKTLYDYWFVQFDFPDANGKPYKSSGGEIVFDETLKREIPKGWEVKSLGNLAEIVGGSTPSTADSDNFCSNGTAWITPYDLSKNQDNKFISHGEIDVSEKGIKNASLKKYPTGTVLMSSRAPIGYMAIARNEVTTNQGFKSFIPNKGFSKEFVFYAVKNSLKSIMQSASGSTFKEVSATTLHSIQAVFPKHELVEKYTERSKKIFKIQDNLEKQNHQLTQLRDFLLPMLMNGQVSVAE